MCKPRLASAVSSIYRWLPPSAFCKAIDPILLPYKVHSRIPFNILHEACKTISCTICITRNVQPLNAWCTNLIPTITFPDKLHSSIEIPSCLTRRLTLGSSVIVVIPHKCRKRPGLSTISVATNGNPSGHSGDRLSSGSGDGRCRFQSRASRSRCGVCGVAYDRTS